MVLRGKQIQTFSLYELTKKNFKKYIKSLAILGAVTFTI